MNIGLSLYSVRDQLNTDFVGTMKKIAGIGYTHMEFAAHSMSAELLEKMPPREIGRVVRELGLVPFTNHINAMGEVDWQQIADFNAELGVQGIVLPFGFMSSTDETLRLAESCNKAAEICSKSGLAFYYHNHFQEFSMNGDRYGMDLFLENTDPSLVGIELDTFWVQRAGIDPKTYMAKIGNRCALVHQKDMGRDTNPVNIFEKVDKPLSMETMFGVMGEVVKPTDFVEIGTGIMDVAGIVAQAKECGSACIIVEQDQISMEVLESLTISYGNLKTLVG